jgi:imidazolonepropionase-like amidohydrolase
VAPRAIAPTSVPYSLDKEGLMDRRKHLGPPTHLDNAQILDPVSGAISEPVTITVADGLIAEIQDRGSATDGRHLDLAGLVVMPGLIDCHVHVTASSADEAAITDTSPSYVTALAAKSMHDMLMRGFTTVRDAAGADYGLSLAVAEGLFLGPRLLFGGPGLTQTGGHADHRGPGQIVVPHASSFPSHGLVCDGEVEARRAARDVLRRGADHIKIMLSGGVASPTDRVESTQFSASEIRAVVEEANAAGRYVLGHAYPAAAINRGLEAGVRSIEHGNLLDETSLDLFIRMNAFLVPTLITYRALAEEGERWGLPARSAAKVTDLLERGLEALRRADEGGVQVAFGTDLLGGMQRRQSEEFVLRGTVQSPLSVIRSATITGAKLLRLDGVIGEVKPGYAADLIAVDGNPLDGLEILAEPEKSVRLVMQSGDVVRNNV